jgi:hypothetical protein
MCETLKRLRDHYIEIFLKRHRIRYGSDVYSQQGTGNWFRKDHRIIVFGDYIL